MVNIEFERAEVIASADCPLAAVVEKAQGTEPAWAFMAGNVISRTMIEARGVQDNEAGQDQLITRFMERSPAEGAIMAASILCVECPEPFCINGQNYKLEL